MRRLSYYIHQGESNVHVVVRNKIFDLYISTTGLPKVVRMTHGHSFHEDMIRYYPPADSLDVITRKTFDGFCRLFLAMPLFHVSFGPLSPKDWIFSSFSSADVKFS